MKKFLVLLIVLVLAGGAVCYFRPDWLPAGVMTTESRDKILAEIKGLFADSVAAPAEQSAAPAEQTPAAVSPLPFLSCHEARAKAKEENRPVLILWYCSDMKRRLDDMVMEWNKLASRNLPVVFGQIDECSGAQLPETDREKLLPTGAFMNLPVAVLLAPDDTLLAIYRGKALRTAAAMEVAVLRTLNMMPQYMAYVEKARNTPGVEGARAAGAALEMMPYADAARNHALKKILNTKDPEHKTMYRYLYGMDHMEMYGEINAVLNGGKGADAKLSGDERQFEAARQFVQQVINAHPMNDELKQQWVSGMAYVHREKFTSTKDAAAKQLMLDCYRQVVEIDPDSEYGKGAARWVRYWDDNVYYVFEEPYYDKEDQTKGFEKEWRVNVSDSMKGPGVYVFSLQPIQDGQMVTRAYKLYANDKHVADATTPENVNTKSVEFVVPRSLKGRIEVRFRAQCNDHWHECSGKMVMEKKR